MGKKKNAAITFADDTKYPPRTGRDAIHNLAGVDLNLLVAFDALMVECNVSRAAERINLSQSAVSHALRRLRFLIGDPLFVRGADGMKPTPRAHSVHSIIAPALAGIRFGLSAETNFVPATSHRRFTFAMSDITSIVFMPELIAEVRRLAPNVDLVIHPTGNTDGVEAVSTGQADFGLSVYWQQAPNLIQKPLAKFHQVVIADPENPAIANGKISLEAYLAAPHVSATAGTDTVNSVEIALFTEGLNRRVKLRIPYFTSLVDAVIGTDLLATLPAMLLPKITNGKNVKVCPIPFPFADVYTSVIWQTSREHDPGHTWMRNLIVDTLGKDV